MTESHSSRKGTKDLFIREDTVKSVEQSGGLAADPEIEALHRPPPKSYSGADASGRFTRG